MLQGENIAADLKRAKHLQRTRLLMELVAAMPCRWHSQWNMSVLIEPPPLCGTVMSGHFESLYADAVCAL